jgi:hypothetical protein
MGVGSIVASLSATYFAQSTTYWSCHFLISLSLAVWNMVFLAAAFKFQPQDGILPDMILSKEMMKNKTLHLLAAFFTIATVIESTIGGIICPLR